MLSRSLYFRKEMKLILIAVALIMLEQILAKECSEAPDVDGCSIPDWVPGKKKFTSSCYKHDVCYSCVSTCRTFTQQNTLYVF